VSANETDVVVTLEQGNLIVGFELPHADALTLARQMAKSVVHVLEGDGEDTNPGIDPKELS